MLRRLGSRPVLAFTVLGVILFSFYVISIVLHNVYQGFVSGTSINGMASTIAAIGWVYIDIALHRKRPNWHQKAVMRMTIYQAILLWCVGTMAVGIVDLMLSQISFVFITTIDAFSVAFCAIFCILYCHITWWPDPRSTRSVLMACVLLEFAIGNIVVSLEGTGKLSQVFVHTGAFILANSLVGLAICLAMREIDRLNNVFTRFIQLYHVMTVICMALEVAYLGTAISANRDDEICLGASVLALNVAHIYVVSRLQTRPHSNLSVEIIDLSSLTDAQCDAYASLIDRYGRSYAGAPSGRHAISLMKAYVKTSNNEMTCVVLRVSRDKVKSLTMPFSENTLPSTYDEMVAWQDLDKEIILPQEAVELEPINKTKGKPTISKSKLKRLQKKNRKEAIAVATTKLQEAEFEEKLNNTEALVLLTRIENYDLTESVKGWFGQCLHRGLGKESYYKPLVVRMGMLAFHWPFKQSTFYTHSTKRPVARSAAVSRAIQEWNKSCKKDKCVLILDPRYENDSTERAIRPSSWNRVPLPASHIIDLRPYKGKTLGEYLKAIKYRNKSSFDGEIIESSNFTEYECETVIKLWKKIATKRTSEGHHAVLSEPTAATISSFKSEDKFRTLLFLKVNGEFIASCVLFRLGDTITSDLQGLDHEEARKHKAYFVMMQHTIEIALKEGLSFVDFGPTTAKPKLDIGCTSVPMMGGITSTNGLLNFSIKYTAQSITNNND